MNRPAPDAPKDEWRRWARAARAEVDFTAVSPLVTTALAGWSAIRPGSTVVTYFAMGDEVDLAGLAEGEWRLAATRTPEHGGLTVHELGGPLEVHRFGFLQPHRSAPQVAVSEIDAVLVPGLAFDLDGGRLGRGAGYYDGLLAAVAPETLLVGIAPEAVVVDHLPTEAHDVPMTHLATETGIRPV